MEALNPENLEAFAGLLVKAVETKNVALIAALAAILAVYLLRRFVLGKVPFFQSKAGGAVLTLVVAFLGSLATSLLGGAAFSGALVLGALQVAFTAAGGWTLVKHLLSVIRKEDPALIKGEAAAAGAAAAAEVAKNPKSVLELINGNGEDKK